MKYEQVVSVQDELNKVALKNYRQHKEEREEKLEAVEKHGIAEAAGLKAAAGRAAHLTQAEGTTYEAQIGKNDSDHFNFLARGQRAGMAVCRLISNRMPIGTGFLVAPGVLITNNHVIPSKDEVSTFVAEFCYELDADDNPVQPIRFRLDDSLFVTSDKEDLDFTIVAVGAPETAGADIEACGWLPMDPRKNKILEGEPTVVIQHPNGDEKRLCLFDSVLVGRFDDYIQYTTDTDFGSSGSPAFNRHWQLIALHHASAPTGEHHQGAPVIVNQGIRVSSILEALKTGKRVQGDFQQAYQRISDPQVMGHGRPMNPVLNVAPAQGIRLRGGKNFTTEKTNIKVRQPDHFEGRKGRQGYDAEFLGDGDLKVELPRMQKWLLDDTVRLLADKQRFCLDYQHFSVAMSRTRKLAIFTAVNIDGETVDLKVGRKDRDPDNPLSDGGPDFEAADKWFYDGRIDVDGQLGNELYDETEFAFGHLVRRQDPVWGSQRAKRIANDDTFFMTNCSPQHMKFNSPIWLKLENAILNAADKNDVKMSVFTGPVLDTRDPKILGVRCPRAFWKVIAYESDGELKARAFLKWQTGFVDEIYQKYERLDQLDKVAADQVSVREISRLTSLDFGPLLEADEFKKRSRRRVDESTLAEIESEFRGRKSRRGKKRAFEAVMAYEEIDDEDASWKNRREEFENI
jgi:endonuclease G